MQQFSDLTSANVRALLPARPLRVLALISSFNEGDVIGQVIGDLIANGCEVYLLDNHSTDDTVAVARGWLGRGLLDIELFPNQATPDADKQYLWREILMRKSQLAAQSGADWIIHADADELRESPWPDTPLADAFGVVDTLGYTAVNFVLYNFRPVNDDFRPGDDLRERFEFYEPGEWVNALQIKAWKNSGVEVDLASTGGHNVGFAERRVFPVPFILRHYPIRSSAHGRRKVLKERLPRYTQQERAAGWHNHYDSMAQSEHTFLWQPENLSRFDPQLVRSQLQAQAFNSMLLATSATRSGLSGPTDHAWALRHASTRTGFAVSVERYAEAFEELRGLLETFQRDKSADNCVVPRNIEIVRVIAQVESAKSDLSGDFRLSFMWNAIDRQLNGNVAPAAADQPQAGTEDLLQQTAAMIAAGDLETAYQLLLSQHDALGGHPTFLFQLGKVGLLSGMFDDARNIFSEAIKLAPGTLTDVICAYQDQIKDVPLPPSPQYAWQPQPRTLSEQGRRHIADGRFDQAQAVLAQAFAEQPEDAGAIVQMGILAQIGRDDARARQLLTQAAGLSAATVDDILSLYTRWLGGPRP